MDKALLLALRLPEADVPVDGVGTVRVRALSRADVLVLNEAREPDEGTSVFEQRLLAAALVDPELTMDEVAVWQANSRAGELEAVVAKVNEICALTDGAAKEAYKAFDENPDAEFRALPGGAVVDDGGPTEG